MNWLTLLGPIFNTFIERVFPDKEKQDEARIAMQQALNQAEATMLQAKSNVITTEINKAGFASNWRAYLMLACVALIVNNWIVIPLLAACGLQIVPTAIPPELWTLVTVGLGGYLGKETLSTYSANKYGPTWDDAKYFNVVKRMFPNGMTQEQVDILNQAKKEASQ
jgi:hypothetical protein